MSKFKSRGLWITDIHLRGGKPTTRKDDYLEAVLEKVAETFSIAKRLKVDYVGIGGDFFNEDRPEPSVCNALIGVIMREGLNSPIIGVVGNHDVRGNTAATLSQSCLGTLVETGLVLVEDEHPDLGIMCGHYETGIEGKTFESEMPLWVIHGYVVPRPLMFGHILIKDYPTTAKVVMAGHYHSGFPVTKRPDGVIFANPGSLGRPRSSDADHMPQACLIEIDGDAVNVEYVALKSAKPIEMAFHMELLNVEKPKGLDATDFIQTMRAATTIVADDAESLDMIEAAGKVKGVEKEVVEEAKRRILQHRGEL